MNKYITKVWLVISVLWALSAHSQVTLTGRVTEQNSGQALFGVNIFNPELIIGATTDSDCKYEITNLPKRKILVRISFIGYKTIIEELDLADNTKKDFTMEESPEEMNEVVVTGSSKATDIRKSPIPISVLESKRINMIPNTNIINALTKLPGISEVTTGPNISKPFIRGLGYNRVLTLFDGVRQEGQQWGDEHGV